MRTLLCTLALIALPVFAVDHSDDSDRWDRDGHRATAREWRQYRENFHREQRQLTREFARERREFARERRDRMREHFREMREFRRAQRDFAREQYRFHWHDSIF